MESAEQVRLAQIARIREEVERATKRLENSHLEALHLLDFAINATTRTVCRDLIAERPKADKMKPPVGDMERNEAISGMKSWLAKVYQTQFIAAYGNAIALGLQTAAQGAADTLRQIPADERPQNIDAFAFQDFFVPAYECEQMAGCLEYVIRELDKGDRNSLDNLRHDYATRSPKRT